MVGALLLFVKNSEQARVEHMFLPSLLVVSLPSDFLHFVLGEQLGCLSLRASDEHSFIVRVLRARRIVWLLPLPFS
jgi:hypothetical protein